MHLSLKSHRMVKADEFVDCTTSSPFTDFLTKTMNDEWRIWSIFCWELQTTISLKVSERVMCKTYKITVIKNGLWNLLLS